MPAEELSRVQLLPRPPRLVDEVVSSLRDSIIDGTLPAGTQLSQVALAEQLGVSRTPLREALRVLESAGLLRTADSHRTAEVVPFGADDLRDLYQLREVIDGLAARLAATHGLPAADQERARELLDELAESSEPYDPVRRDRTHTQFHELVANASDNDKVRSFAFLIRISSAVLYLPLRRQATAANLAAVDPGKSYREILEQAQIQHREIVDAIVARDPDAAEAAARRHIQQTLRLATRLGLFCILDTILRVRICVWEQECAAMPLTDDVHLMPVNDQRSPARPEHTPAYRADIDPARFETRWFGGRGFRQAYVRVGEGGIPLLLIHGWPETKRLYWRVIEPLAAAGFEVIAPDLRGYGESEVGPDGKHDAPASSRDLHALVTQELGHRSVVVGGGDFGGGVAQDLALRFPGFVSRLVITNCPLPYDRDAMTGLRTRGSRESLDYYRRQGTEADELITELGTPGRRRRYIETFYTSRHWAHPGAFTTQVDEAGGYPDLAFHCAPFEDAERLRASWGAYEARYSPQARSEPALTQVGCPIRTLVLFGPSDHVIPPDFDRMAALVFPDHVGPFLLRDCGHFVPWEAARAFASGTTALCSDLLALHRTAPRATPAR